MFSFSSTQSKPLRSSLPPEALRKLKASMEQEQPRDPESTPKMQRGVGFGGLLTLMLLGVGIILGYSEYKEYRARKEIAAALQEYDYQVKSSIAKAWIEANRP